MGFNSIKRIKEWKREQRRFIEGKYKRYGVEPSFSIDGEEINLSELKDRSLRVNLKDSRGNSAGQNIMIRKMDNKSLINYIYNSLVNVGIRSDSDTTYDESIMNILLPELLDRFEDLDRKLNSSKNKEDIVLDSDEESDNIPSYLGIPCRSVKLMTDTFNEEVMNGELSELSKRNYLNIEEPLG